MKVISVWNPFATLLVEGFKCFETRSWKPPASIVGQRIGIASTKRLLPGQRMVFNHPSFRKHYNQLGLLDKLEEMSNGYLLGTVVIDSYEVVTPEFVRDLSAAELMYGHYYNGSYAWRAVDPIPLEYPIPIRGSQGIFEWAGKLPGL